MITKEKVLRQIDLLNEVNEIAKIGMVVCPNCDCLFLHRIENEPVECPYCAFTDDESEFMPVYFKGMENAV